MEPKKQKSIVHTLIYFFNHQKYSTKNQKSIVHTLIHFFNHQPNFSEKQNITDFLTIKSSFQSKHYNDNNAFNTLVKISFIGYGFERCISFFNYQLIYLFLFFLFYYNWRIIALQYYVGFYLTSTWISHSFTHVPSHLNIL